MINSGARRGRRRRRRRSLIKLFQRTDEITRFDDLMGRRIKECTHVGGAASFGDSNQAGARVHHFTVGNHFELSTLITELITPCTLLEVQAKTEDRARQVSRNFLRPIGVGGYRRPIGADCTLAPGADGQAYFCLSIV